MERRTFIKGAAAVALGIAFGLRRSDPPAHLAQISSLDQLLEFRVLPPVFGTAAVLAGISPNHPWLWEHIDSKERIEREVEKAEKMPTSTIRIFLDDRVEPRLGQYQYALLDKVARLSERINLQVDLFDAYNLLHSDTPNRSFGGYEPTSPYLGRRDGRSLSVRKAAFFTDKRMVETFQNRVSKFVTYLKGISGIKVWSMGNELEADPAVLTPWYSQILPVIREVDPDRPILAGVADPTLLDERVLQPLGLTANTIHIYPDPINNQLGQVMDRYFTDHQRTMPLICQEIGVPRLPGDLGYDWIYSRFLNQTLLSFVEVNQLDGWVRPTVSGLGPWRLIADNDKSDGHDIDPDQLPETMGVIWTWDEIMKKSTDPASSAA